MNHPSTPSSASHDREESWENDAVWTLLDRAAPPAAPSNFVDQVTRMTRLEEAPIPWWQRIFAPAPLTGFAAAAAALALAFVALTGSPDSPQPETVETAEPFAEIEDAAFTEALLAAIDHPDAFTDLELVELIGF